MIKRSINNTYILDGINEFDVELLRRQDNKCPINKIHLFISNKDYKIGGSLLFGDLTNLFTYFCNKKIAISIHTNMESDHPFIIKLKKWLDKKCTNKRIRFDKPMLIMSLYSNKDIESRRWIQMTYEATIHRNKFKNIENLKIKKI